MQWVVRGLMGLAALALLAGLFTGWQVIAARGELLAARGSLTDGAQAVTSFDGEEALAAFNASAAQAEAAHRRLSNPVVRPFDVVPIVGHNLRASRAVAGSAAAVAGAGERVAAATLELPDGLGTLAPRGGRIPVEAIDRVAPVLAEAHDDLVAARAVVEASPSEGLVGQVAEARAQLTTELGWAEPLLGDAAVLSEALPSFLGLDETRRYFFGAQNPAELRGTGGFIGAYAILTVEEGDLDFTDFQSIINVTTLPVDGPEPPSEDFEERYRRFGGAGFAQNANFTPDVPTAASVLEELYAYQEGEDLDGTILADPQVFEAMLAVTGPVEIPDVGEVTSETVVDLVANEAYALLPDSPERKEILGDVAQATIPEFLGPGVADRPVPAAEALIDVAAGGNMRFHSQDPDEQAVFDDVGISGRLSSPEDGGLLAVVGNNVGANKLDFYTDRDVRHTVWLADDGSATARTTVTLANDAPTEGQPIDVIGPNVGAVGVDLEAGESRTHLSVFCGPDCEPVTSWRGAAEVAPDEVGSELGYDVVTTTERLKSGQSRTRSHDWVIPEAWDPDEGVYRLKVAHQPTIRTTDLELRIVAPDGLVVRDSNVRLPLGQGETVWEGELTEDLDVAVALGEPGRTPLARLVEWLGEPAFTIGDPEEA